MQLFVLEFDLVICLKVLLSVFRSHKIPNAPSFKSEFKSSLMVWPDRSFFEIL